MNGLILDQHPELNKNYKQSQEILSQIDKESIQIISTSDNETTRLFKDQSQSMLEEIQQERSLLEFKVVPLEKPQKECLVIQKIELSIPVEAEVTQ